MKNIQIAGLTDVGRARTQNEDNLIEFDSPNGYVVAVCDGMGGENGGATASDLAVTIIKDILTNNTFSTPQEAIVKACNAANQGILHRASSRPELGGMGSTCVIAIIQNDLIYYGWIGDSRIYYYTPNQGLEQLSKDQSYVQTLVDNGEITPEEAECHPRKNEILNALGIEEMTPPVICQEPIPVNAGGTLMLCSDGLSGMVPNFTIERVLSQREKTPSQRCEQLINLANEAGGLDNITVQIIECSAPAAVGVPPTGFRREPVTEQPKKSSNTKFLVGIAVISVLLVGVIVYLCLDLLKDDKPTPIEPAKIEQVDKKNKPSNKPDTNTTTITIHKGNTISTPKPQQKQENPKAANAINKNKGKGDTQGKNGKSNTKDKITNSTNKPAEQPSILNKVKSEPVVKNGPDEI